MTADSPTVEQLVGSTARLIGEVSGHEMALSVAALVRASVADRRLSLNEVADKIEQIMEEVANKALDENSAILSSAENREAFSVAIADSFKRTYSRSVGVVLDPPEARPAVWHDPPLAPAGH